MSPSDFKREDQILPDFSKIHELTLDFSYHPHRKESRLSRGDPEPVFKNLRWKL
jgi:hypothetical protein